VPHADPVPMVLHTDLLSMTTKSTDLASRADKPMSLNMKLLSQHELDGYGGMGEGMSMQRTADGRRILWLAHESGPKNFTGVDVTDPREPKMVVQTELPGPKMRSNSLDVVGSTLAVAYQTSARGAKEAGFELFDVSVPEKPRSISFFSCAGPASRGVHQLWFVDGEFIHASSGAPDFTPRNPADDQIYRSFDVRNPSRPVESGRWWLPGLEMGDPVPAPARHAPGFDSGFRTHNTNVYPERPDRCYIGYVDAGVVVLDISDRARPQMLCHWDPSPPFPGFTHTVLPIFARDLLVVSDESVKDNAADWPKLVWVLDYRAENNPVPISTFPMAPRDAFGKRGGRFGAHNLHENQPGSFRSDDIVIGTFFNGGVRAFDISDPYRPEEVAYYVPAAPKLAPTGAIQLNDVYVDDRGIVFTMDRHVGGLYALEMNV
jgi:hypothetical protein